MNQYQRYAQPLTRLAIALVFLWFGINQIIVPENFIGYLPEFILAASYAKNIVLLNGITELILGALLAIGLYTRAVSAILCIHLFTIIISIGYNDIAVRDVGLMLVAFAIALHGPDQWCWDRRNIK
ncbi:MAG TPA: DoxX family membrane protein [Candidatus Nanoarchaeia archaeon]|nr:DoxX family membrane protein [Candidatus Nanoarchaeia archaeon]